MCDIQQKIIQILLQPQQWWVGII